MVNDVKWEVKLPSLLNKSSHEVLNIVNSILKSDFEELDIWLNEQVEKNNLKGFKRNKINNAKFRQRETISILDLKFNEGYFKKIRPMKYNDEIKRWEEIEFNNEVFLRSFVYTLKIQNNSDIYDLIPDNFEISITEPWFVDVDRINVKQLKTQKNVTIRFSVGFRYDNEITNDELYPNISCDHEFRLLYNGNWNWHLVWECEKCGFICFCSCFKEAIEGCRKGKIITERKIFQDAEPRKRIQKVKVYDKTVFNERGFSLKDLNLNTDDIPYFDNACEVCREKTSSHRYCHKMYARSEFERKYGAYAKKKFFEYKLLDEDVNDEDLERRTNNLTREEL